METAAGTTASSSISQHLEGYRHGFADTRRRAHELAATFTENQMNWHPAPGKWSMADCLVHLSEAGEIYVPIIRKAIASARSRGLVRQGPYDHGMLGRFYIKMLEPPPGMKMPAPPTMTAGLKESRHDVAQVLDRFDRLGRDFESLLAEADGLNLEKIRFPSVISKFMRMNLAAWFEFNGAHERRHLWQAERVPSAPGFPG